MILTTLLGAAFLVFLELGSRWYISTTPSQELPPSLICDQNYYPIQEEKIQLLEEIVQKHLQGEPITAQELEGVALLAPQEDMPALNGIFCSGMIIVSSRLEGPARTYVIRHELEHVYQDRGLRPGCSDPEFCATWAAAWEYPRGFLAAIRSSGQEAYRLSPSTLEFLFSSWHIFKVYFLPG